MNMNNNYNGRGRLVIGGVLIMAVVVSGMVYMLVKQKNDIAGETEKRVADEKKGPVVKALKVGMAASDKGLVLIGEARPYQSVTLYAKTSGYMNNIFVDKGDKVQQGKLLATIVSPETDQAYKAAVADLENKKKIEKRDKALVQKDYISKEDAEASETAVKMAEAQVRSLKEQMDYKNITAPFSGTVTARFADPGALVQNATGSQTSAQPIVTVSELDRIRIYVYVSQADAASLKEGYPVTITMTENPSLKIPAKVTRIAGELDPKTRMMLAEIDIPNKDNAIIPGSYLQVTFKAQEKKFLTIPSESVVIRQKKFYVPVIDDSGKIHFNPVTLINNDGIHATVQSGVAPGDLVGVNVSPEITEGEKVQVQQ
jgi:membrane fusion protein, multidrug efflux system